MRPNKKGMAIAASVCSLLLAYLLNRAALLYLSLTGNPVVRLNTTARQVWGEVLRSPLIMGLSPQALGAGLVGILLVWMVYLYVVTAAGKYMHGIEHGSARWGTKADIAPYLDKEPRRNILLTETESLSMSNRMKRTKTDDYNRNKNVIVVGGSGSGKTRFFVKPNLMQLHSSYVITDPKGNLVHECGKMLAENGYRVKVFNLVNLEMSDQYNPFTYLRTEDDVLKLITNLMANTSNPNKQGGDSFWDNAETLLFNAIFAYLLFEVRAVDRTLPHAADMVRMGVVREDDDEFMSPLDVLFDDLKKSKPECFAVLQYDGFKLAAGVVS